VLAAAVEPELEELGVAVDLGDGRQCIRSKRPVSSRNYVEHNCQKPTQRMYEYGNYRTFATGAAYVSSTRDMVAASSIKTTRCCVSSQRTNPSYWRT